MYCMLSEFNLNKAMREREKQGETDTQREMERVDRSFKKCLYFPCLWVKFYPRTSDNIYLQRYMHLMFIRT